MSNQFTRQPVQIIEMDLDYCGLTYGTAPCRAALDANNPRKCYNFLQTCQDKENFGAPIEPVGGPHRTYAPLDAIITADFDKSADFFFAVNLFIPLSPDGCVWEIGGSTTGAYCGFTNGLLVFRAGDGATGFPANAAKVAVDPASIIGTTGTLYGQIDISADKVTLWHRDALTNTIVELANNTASGTFALWAGTNASAFGRVNSSAPVDESTANFNGILTEMRAYDATTFVPVTPGIENTLTLRYSRNIAGVPRGLRIYPAVSGPASTTPTKINISGVAESSGPLGRRATVRIPMSDFKEDDRDADKYQAERVSGAAQFDGIGYNPLERGTHFGRMRRRFPFYTTRPLRILEGLAGQSLSAMRTRHYVLTDWSGPDHNGSVLFEAADVLTLADNDKAKCPKPSNGVIGSDIPDTGSGFNFQLLPAGIGIEYPASGRASIGSEIIRFTRTDDTIVVVERSVDGSEISSHTGGDTFQLCFRVEDKLIADIVAELMTDFANIDSAFIPIADWVAENERWLAGLRLTATVPTPEGVLVLLGELGQMGAYWFWDDVGQEIIMRSNRPVDVGETIVSLDENSHILEKSLRNRDLESERITDVFVAYNITNAAGDVSANVNYDRFINVRDEDAASEREYNQARTLTIQSRWLKSSNESAIKAFASRLLNRYRDIPRELTFTVDAAKVTVLDVGSPADVTTEALQADDGSSLPTQMQLTSVEEVESNNRVEVTMQDYNFTGRYGFVTEAGRSDYVAATDAEKVKGTYIVDSVTLKFGDGTDPYIMF